MLVSAIGFALFAVGCALLYAFFAVKQSFARKYRRQKQLLDQFNLFAASNRVLKLNEARVQKFMDDTSDVANYFLSSDILNMRHSLHDNAQSLLSLGVSTDQSKQSPEAQTEIADLEKETIAWFESAMGRMSDLFESGMKLTPSILDVCKQILKIAGRAIRA